MATYYSYGQRVDIPDRFYDGKNIPGLKSHMRNKFGLDDPGACQQLFEQYLKNGWETSCHSRHSGVKRPLSIALLISEPSMLRQFAHAPARFLAAASTTAPTLQTRRLSAQAAGFIPSWEQRAHARTASTSVAVNFRTSVASNTADEGFEITGLFPQQTRSGAGAGAAGDPAVSFSHGAGDGTQNDSGQTGAGISDPIEGNASRKDLGFNETDASKNGIGKGKSRENDSGEIFLGVHASSPAQGNAHLGNTRIAPRRVSRWTAMGHPAFVSRNQWRPNIDLQEHDAMRVQDPEKLELLQGSMITTPSDERWGAIGSERASSSIRSKTS